MPRHSLFLFRHPSPVLAEAAMGVLEGAGQGASCEREVLALQFTQTSKIQSTSFTAILTVVAESSSTVSRRAPSRPPVAPSPSLEVYMPSYSRDAQCAMCTALPVSTIHGETQTTNVSHGRRRCWNEGGWSRCREPIGARRRVSPALKSQCSHVRILLWSEPPLCYRVHIGSKHAFRTLLVL